MRIVQAIHIIISHQYKVMEKKKFITHVNCLNYLYYNFPSMQGDGN